MEQELRYEIGGEPEDFQATNRITQYDKHIDVVLGLPMETQDNSKWVRFVGTDKRDATNMGTGVQSHAKTKRTLAGIGLRVQTTVRNENGTWVCWMRKTRRM